MPFTVRGTCQVLWKPAYTLVLASTDGASLPANGKGHELVATLTRTANGSAVPNRKVKLGTNPTGRQGDGAVAWTDGSGKARFQIADGHNEDVVYTGTLLSDARNKVTGATTVTWTGSVACFRTCKSLTGSSGGRQFNDADETPNWVRWWVAYDVRCYDAGGNFTVVNKVLVGESLIFTGATEPGVKTCADMKADIGAGATGAQDTTGYSCSLSASGPVLALIADGTPYDDAWAAALAAVTAGAC